MAEFQEVMRQLNRLCSHYQNCGENGCPMFDECGNIGAHCSQPKQSYRIEKTVMTWAAEHPEPVYPSVAKYLERFGIIIRRDGTLEADFFKAHEPMCAYVANLLGVDLVEGENEKAD